MVIALFYLKIFEKEDFNMKTKTTLKNLLLKKETVTRLDEIKMQTVKGGDEPPLTEETCRRRAIALD